MASPPRKTVYLSPNEPSRREDAQEGEWSTRRRQQMDSAFAQAMSRERRNPEAPEKPEHRPFKRR